MRAAYQRSYFAPALFSLVPVETDLIGSMAVDAHWRLYYNDAWLARTRVEENAALLIHEVSHLLRDHEARKNAGRRQGPPALEHRRRLRNQRRSPRGGTAAAGRSAAARQVRTAEREHRRGLLPAAAGAAASGRSAAATAIASRRADCGSGAHGERRFWELPADDERDGGTPGVDRLKAELVRREVARRIDEMSPYAGDVPLAWRRWARATLAPKVDYMATIRHAVRRALRDSTLGRYDRTYRRPHRRQACYGEFIMPSFHQPRPRPGFLIDTSGSMGDSQLARAVSELGGLTRQLGYGADVVVACCDAAVHDVRKVFAGTQVELYGGGGTDMGVGLRAFIERKSAPIDLLVIVSDCHTPWPTEAPPFPVITIRVGDGAPPPWGNHGANRVITIEEPAHVQREQARRR